MTEALDRIERVFATHRLPEAPDVGERHALLQRRALAVLGDRGDSQPQHVHVALLFYAADLLASQAIELAAHRERAMGLIDQLTDVIGVSKHALAREVLRNSSLLGFPPAVAIEVQLGLLMAFAPLRDVSLWMTDDTDAPQAVCQVGERQGGSAPQELARRVLRGKAPLAERGALMGFAVKRWHEHAAALIGRPERGERERCAPVLEETIPVLGTILERERLIKRNATAERTLGETYERRLTRLGFDIHDGPLQDLAMLSEDVQLLRRQLSDVLEDDLRRIMLGRLDDLHAQLASLDCDLRRISASLQSPFTGPHSLHEAVANMVRAFAARTQVEPALVLEGDLKGLTDSQQMALLSIIREALSNVREHSDASQVAVSLEGGPMSIELHITDNGSGFDVEQALVRAARDGRFGLAGVHERTRLLGGSSHIESAPGHPTTVSVMLPRWRAVAPEGE